MGQTGPGLSNGEVWNYYAFAALNSDGTVVSGTTWSYADSRTLLNNQTVSYTARVADAAGNFQLSTSIKKASRSSARTAA
jgi:ABC-type uncharacterized transport system YnjBCD substrate-binding protein